MSIKFDSQACIMALKQELMFSMKQLQQELLNEAKQGMNTPEGRESLTDGDIEDIANVISVSIIGGAWVAMDEFGKGSAMQRDNPALSGYIGGGLWNPQRMGYTIVGRPKGTYTNIFGETVRSSGKLEGREIEHLIQPIPPSKAIQNAARWMKSFRMQKVIRSTLSIFNFGKFIITDKR